MYFNQFLIALLFATSPLLSINGQVNLEESLTPCLNAEAISQAGFKSLQIYAELNEDPINERGSYSGKLEEYEFNKNGQVVYWLRSNNRGNLPFIAYGRGSYIHLNTYDEQQNLILDYKENYRNIEENIFNYDEEGNKSDYTIKYDGDTVLSYHYTWKRNKLIETHLNYSNSANKDRINAFDQKGRISHAKTASREVKYTYTEKEDTLITQIKTFRADTLYNLEEHKVLSKFNRMVSYIQLDHKKDTVVEMKAELDQFGNAIFYYLNNTRNKMHGNTSYPPHSYRIENVYNESNLLTKRSFFYSRSDVGENELVKIEHYVYLKNSLPFKFKKGDIYEDSDTQVIDR
ncbi:hypothetical protein [Brumimicrobium aurantiacum]|uniref:Uncharacterized protein n=1 Tax=Brumimicrobium aurantiacum TaxID=1737063 RepID=A0A3E1EZU0_9FLAO|nr:hypothetical protein [Brumimicrobium aurantiacum]RFC55068.1 hypothetical protein DXU93_04405 [Brumimicrobium aurantiacum]